MKEMKEIILPCCGSCRNFYNCYEYSSLSSSIDNYICDEYESRFVAVKLYEKITGKKWDE